MRMSFQRLGREIIEPGTARSRWASLVGGAVVSAGLLALYSRVESPWFGLGFVALVPWIFALDRAASWIEAAGAGAIMSAAFAVLVFSWFPAAAQGYSKEPSLLLWLLLVAAAPLIQPQFLSFAVVRYLARRAPGRWSGLQAVVAAACAYVGTELVFPKLFFDTLGQGLYPSLYLRQAADIAGVHGITLLLLLVNEGVHASLGPWVRRASRSLVPLMCALGLILVQLAYGYLRYAQITSRNRTPGTTVGLVQANITNYDRLRAEKGAFETVRAILDTHYALSDVILKRGRPDLIVWPETVYPTTFGSPQSEAGAAFDEEITSFARSRGVPLVFGAYDAEAGREFNAAFFLNASAGGRPLTSAYRKRMLFPLTEWVPDALDTEWLRSALPWAGRWQRGPGPRVVEQSVRDGRSVSVLPLICYDALFPGFVAEGARMGADLIITLSNDSWFPDARAPRLHLISAAFRSIETRLPQVRATNSGISAAIVPTGEITAATGWDQRETLVETLPRVERIVTLAVAWQHWLGPVLLSAAALALLQSVVRGRGARGEPVQDLALKAGGERPHTRERARSRRAGKKSRPSAGR